VYLARYGWHIVPRQQGFLVFCRWLWRLQPDYKVEHWPSPLWGCRCAANSTNLEWRCRVIQEPGRMWMRYLTTNTKFA